MEVESRRAKVEGSGSASPARTEELEETRSLVRMVSLFLENYRNITNNTRTDQVVRKASRRVEEALIECMRKATDELAPSSPGSFECSSCGVQHDLERDLKVLRDERCSSVLLQRRFRYSYTHAMAVMEQLVSRGFVVRETDGKFRLASDLGLPPEVER